MGNTGLRGPMFESPEGSVFGKEGAHYNIYRVPVAEGMKALREMFPDGEANELNFVLFSTSGVHGSYATIEEVDDNTRGVPEEGIDEVTFVIVHPRLVCMRYGNAKPETDADFAFLKKLRSSSWAAVQKVGRPSGEEETGG